jgi:hypothetical protein
LCIVRGIGRSLERGYFGDRTSDGNFGVGWEIRRCL